MRGAGLSAGKLGEEVRTGGGKRGGRGEGGYERGSEWSGEGVVLV